MRRWAWIAVLIGGTALYLVLLARLVDTQDPALVPTLVLLAGVIVPATFVVFAMARSGQWREGGSTLATSAFVGAVIGTAVAARLPFDHIPDLSAVQIGLAALVQEAAKLVVPALAIALWRRRPDWLVVGMAIGMGFAALETMGQAFTTLLSAQGDVSELTELLFIRALVAPGAQAAWTGLACLALARLAARPGAVTIAGFGLTFLAVVVLHALWDGLHTEPAYVGGAAVSVAWLGWELYRTHERFAVSR